MGYTGKLDIRSERLRQSSLQLCETFLRGGIAKNGGLLTVDRQTGGPNDREYRDDIGGGSEPRGRGDLWIDNYLIVEEWCVDELGNLVHGSGNVLAGDGPAER